MLAWRHSAGAAIVIGTIIAVDACQNLAGLGCGGNTARLIQTCQVSVHAADQCKCCRPLRGAANATTALWYTMAADDRVINRTTFRRASINVGQCAADMAVRPQIAGDLLIESYEGLQP